MILRPDVPMIHPTKLHSNVGACLDIPTGKFKKGKYGESVFAGGVPLLFGITGKSNNFKSTLLMYMLLTVLYRLSKNQASLSWYDTEVNVDLMRLAYMASLIEGFEDFDAEENNIFLTGLWAFSDKGNISGNKWIDKIQLFLMEKIKNSRSHMADSPFLDLDGKTLIRWMTPTASALDSITEFETDDVLAMRDKTEIGESKANTINLRQGAGKDRLTRELPSLTSRGSHFFGSCAQYGKLNGMADGPTPPRKTMNTMRQDEKIRGIPESYLFLTLHLWLIDGSELLMSDDKTNAEYPIEEGSVSEASDLYKCPVKMLRSKTGPAGFTVPVIVSQKRGVQPSLTEYYNIQKMNKQYGMSTTGSHLFELDLLPGVNVRRTTVRKVIDENVQLRRALNLTSEICQIENYHEGMKGNLPSMKDIRSKLTADGYDWDVLLNTRGWWTFNNDKQKTPFLSSMDLVEMYNGNYEPFWLSKDKKSIRKEFTI